MANARYALSIPSKRARTGIAPDRHQAPPERAQSTAAYRSGFPGCQRPADFGSPYRPQPFCADERKHNSFRRLIIRHLLGASRLRLVRNTAPQTGPNAWPEMGNPKGVDEF